MSNRSNSKIPSDVQDGIRDVMDKQVKVCLKLLVKMETRGDKTENKVLAFSPCRLFVLNAKVPSKLEHSFHFLDIQNIESKKSHQLALTIDGKVYVFQALETNTDEIDHIITHIGISMKQIFPSFPLERLIAQVDVHPVERLKVMNDLIKAMESKTPGPCGGYTTMYQCMCDYHAMPFREEVEWDVDTIYLSLDSRDFRLQDFDHLLARDLVPIIGALEHNAWFKTLDASNVKLSVEACSELIRVMKRNAVIEEINLSNTGIRSDFVQKFALALISNSGTQLSKLDISNNLLEDRGINHLLGSLKHLPCGLSSFDMSRTGVSTKCLNKVGEVLSQSANIMASLCILKLNDNGLKGEDFPLLYNCLAQPNTITYLDLSSTDCALDSLCDPLLRGCLSLTTFRASGTSFTHKRSKVQVPLSWKQFFSSSCYLEFVDLSNCRLPPEALKELLLGVSANRNLKGLHLNVSSNELGPSGAALISPCIQELSGVGSLDISNNGFDIEIKTLLTELAKNHHIKQLSLGRNFVNIKPKFRPDVMSALTLLLQEESSCLESLSLADSKLKGETAYIINALGSNETLLEIDISGNSIGDLGARMLAKALMINSKLRQVVWDKNNISAQGFEDVAEALEKNLALKKMPYPVNDAAAALRMYPERTEIALQKIETCLQRNHSPRRFAPDQAYRLQQGFLISSTQQMVDKLVVTVEDTVNALLKTSSAETHAHEVESAQKLVVDANSSRQLLPSLQDIALKSQAAGNVVDSQLNAMADSLRKAIEEQLEKTTEEMLQCTSSHCPAVMEDQTFYNTILEGCQSKSALPKDFTTGVLETAATDIYNTTSEMNLAVANLISDNVIEGVIESLSTSLKSLTTHLNVRTSGLFRDDEKEEEDSMDRLRLPTESSPKIANKRKSVLSRKTRPQSTMGDDSVVQNLPRAPAAENHVLSKVKESSAASSRSGSSEQLAELPDLPTLTMTSKPLEHVTKARPRRAKAHRPTRPVVNTGTTEIEDSIDTILDSPAPVPLTSSSPKAPERKDHKAKKEKEESPASSKSKQEEGASGKTEGKRWMPSFMKKKEEKSKKEPKKSFSLFKKRGSEDRKRPSLTNEDKSEASEPDPSNTSNSHTENGERPVDTSIDVIKESNDEVSEVKIMVNEDEATKKSAGPVAPRRMLPHDRAAKLPPTSKSAGEKKSPESQKSLESTSEDQKKGFTEKIKQESSPKSASPSHSQHENVETEEGAEKRQDPPKLPPGVAKMPGLGALGGKSLLQEIELKQKKRLSPKPVSPGEEQKELVAPAAKPSTETNNNVQNQTSQKATPTSPTNTTTDTLATTVTYTPEISTSNVDTPTVTSPPTTSASAADTPTVTFPPATPASPADAPTATSPPTSASTADTPTVTSPPTSASTADTPTATSPPAISASDADTSTATSPPTPTSLPAATSTVVATSTVSTPAAIATSTSTVTTTPTKLPPERPSRPSRPQSSAVTSKKGDNAPNTSEPSASPSKHPVPPTKRPLPSAAPRALAANKRPTSVVETPGTATKDLPSSMTTSTPEFQLAGSPTDVHVPLRPHPPPKARPPIMPRPKKRDSAPPSEESSDIQAQSDSTTPTVTTTSISSASHDFFLQDEPKPFSTNQALEPTLPSLIASNNSHSSSSKWNKSANVMHKSNTETQSQVEEPSPIPPLPLNTEPSSKPKEHGPSIQEELRPLDKGLPTTISDSDAKVSSTEPSPSEEGIVYDSATLRMSVKDKIKRLAGATQTGADPPKVSAQSSLLVAKTKAMSLPKDARLLGSPHDSDSIVGDKSMHQNSKSSIPEEEVVASVEAEVEQSQHVAADSNSNSEATKVPNDEIMV